jgi:phage baseplate assembly protein gpV
MEAMEAYGPNGNRWFTVLNSMVDLSMANWLLVITRGPEGRSKEAQVFKLSKLLGQISWSWHLAGWLCGLSTGKFRAPTLTTDQELEAADDGTHFAQSAHVERYQSVNQYLVNRIETLLGVSARAVDFCFDTGSLSPCSAELEHSI